jgi:tRNA pseudouridine38-40 synthase
MRTIKLTIAYDGTRYQGWQIQPKGPTIQGVIEEKLSVLMGEKVDLIGAGRTDAGAHASGQVAHFKTEGPMKILTIQKALNSLLPPDIVIRKVEEVGENFHARKSPRSKIYEYRILNEPVRSPFHREYAWHLPTPLNWGEMKRATKKLIGQHDFSSFRSAGSSAKTSIRKVARAEWKHSRDGLVRFEIEGNGFLKQMVRAIVGTLVEVGKGKISAAEFQQIIESKDRKKAGPTAPAHGLFLKEVKY